MNNNYVMVFSREATILCFFLLFTVQVLCQEYIRSKNVVDPDYEYTYEGIVCLASEFKCAAHEQCIFSNKRCDGTPFDCLDNSDEANCTNSEATSTSMSTYPAYEDCDEKEFDCGANECFPNSIMCDGVQDCENGKDEMNCPVKTTPASIVKYAEYEDCLEEEVACGDGACLPNSILCDGVQDCENGNDEMNCPVAESEAMETTSVSLESTSHSTRQMEVSASALSTTPFINSIKCVYENKFYAAGAQIVVNNCTEVTCSQSGRILEWNNPDPICGGSMVKATTTMLSTENREMETTSVSLESTSQSTRQSEVFLPTSSARPLINRIECVHENKHYAIGAQIVKNMCWEVSCSQSGKILEWSNPDPACSGSMTKQATAIFYAILISILVLWQVQCL